MARATPATRAAAHAGIDFRVHEYAHVAGAEYGTEAAAQLGVDAARVFKTLIASTTDGRHVIGVVPVAAHLDLKALANAVGAKQAGMAQPDDAARLTGYVLGGISPLGQKRRLAAVVDASVSAHDSVFVSAGRRGLEIELAPHDLLQLTDAALAEIARW